LKSGAVAGTPLGVIRQPDKNGIMEFDVINERIGVFRRERQPVARQAAAKTTHGP
jgi:hypothetical protein